MDEKFVLIDTDAGIDDAWAIFMAFAAHRNRDIPFTIVGITCTHGNTNLDNVTVNVTRTLNAVGASDIPVYRGSESALVLPFVPRKSSYHGNDGFGDTGLPPVELRLQSEHAVNAIIRLAEQYKGKLSIVTLGPLTNLALAFRLQPKIVENIKNVYILGGKYEGLVNATIWGEFNFLADAEAAHIVLDNSALCPIFLCPWETYKFTDLTYSFRVNTLGKMDTPQTALMNAAEGKLLAMASATDRWSTADQLIVAILLDSDVMTTSMKCHCTVELSGKYSRGMMLVDTASSQQNPLNCTIIKSIDLSMYKKMLIWAAGGPHYKTQT